MYFLQSFIVGAVVVHNEYNHWTPNKLVPVVIGIALAYLATVVIWRGRH